MRELDKISEDSRVRRVTSTLGNGFEETFIHTRMSIHNIHSSGVCELLLRGQG